MKTLLSILILILAAAAAQSLLAQTTTLTFQSLGSGPERQQNIAVPAGQVFELLTWSPSNPAVVYLKVDGIDIPLSPTILGGSSAIAYNPQKIVVSGPKTVSVHVPAIQQHVCTYKLTTDSTIATQDVASQVVVIPENAAANADVILEQSTDLINWTAALPGSYAPSTAKRFFRVRLVLH